MTFKKHTFDEYKALPGINASALKCLRESPAAYRRYVDRTVDRDTPSMSLGRAAHLMMLEPWDLHTKYAVWTGGRRGTKAYAEFVEQNAGKEILKQEEMETIEKMNDAFWASPAVKSLKLNPGQSFEAEMTVQWTDKPTGIECKGLVDILGHNRALVADIKTTRDPTPHAFGRDASRLLYHLQMAHYAAGYKAIQETDPEVYIIAVRSSEPFDCYVYQITGDDMARAERQRRRYLNKLKECMDQDVWADPSHEINALEVGEWAYDEPEVELTVGGEPLSIGDESESEYDF